MYMVITKVNFHVDAGTRFHVLPRLTCYLLKLENFVMSCLAKLCPNVAQPVSQAVILSDEPRYRAAIIAKYLVKLTSN